jgi:hypothetical protein
MRHVAALALAMSLAAGFVAGCSNGDEPAGPAGDFADATCVDLAKWANAIQLTFTDLQNIEALDVDDRSEVGNVVTRLRTSIGGAEQATSDLAKGLESRPAPSIASGADVKKTLVDGFNSLRELLSSTRAKLIDFDPQTATPEQASQLKTDLANLEGDALTSVSRVSVLSENEELRKAFEGSDTCKEASSGLVSGSS